MQCNPQVPWTEEQWARVNCVIQEEAQRARVAATFLPLYGPLPASADFVRTETVAYQPLRIADKNTTQLATLQLRVRVRGEQLAEPELRSVLTLFRRAANVLARLEDALIFNGYEGYDPDGIPPPPPPPPLPRGAPNIGEQIWGGAAQGLLIDANDQNNPPALTPPHQIPVFGGNGLVDGVVDAIGYLESRGHFGPFAVVLSQELFSIAQKPVNILGARTPSAVPQDRILPFLGGGSLLRSSALPDGYGVVVALAGAPIELIVATDMSLQFLQVTEPVGPYFVFRVYEKVALRIKERDAIVALVPGGPIVITVAPPQGPVAGGTPVTITGNHFTGATGVDFGQNPGTTLNVVNDRQITVVTPAGQANQTVNVTVTTPLRTSNDFIIFKYV